MSKFRVGLCALALTAVMVAVSLPLMSPRPAEALTTADIGVVPDLTWGISRADMDRTLSAMSAAGVKSARMGIEWSGVEPDAKGVWHTNWLAEIDAAVAKARAAGIEVLMPLGGVPYWASADPNKYTDGSGQHWNKHWKPTNTGDYVDFVRTMVNRYKSQGVHVYQVWNEPNLGRFWPSGPNAAEYVQMLKAAYPAIKQADPSATVVLGGLSGNDYNYLAQLYGAGARSYFDLAAVHPYTGAVDPTWCWNQAGTTKKAKDAFCGIEEVRNTMVANGDSGKSIWLTEFGWSTTTAEYGVSEAAQADFLTKALVKLASYPYVTKAFWYNFRNNYWSNNDPAEWEANSGLLRVNFSQKPAYAALKAYTTDGTSGAAMDTQAPTISNVTAADIKSSSASVRWITDEVADSTVEYWRSGSSTMLTTSVDSRLVTMHGVPLSGLARRATYSYRVRSVDSWGNIAVSSTSSFKTTRK
ncbi:MAG: cellulase family glycosylhydrolase [Actinomycetota bacterium]|nr:cellulase family glycosylhydrolase [Actinomycetota bacterium]